ncbi:MAG: hypothetical protein MZV64_27895 [Ignavibacteriales bacterium]|nr:hypothetical protein [Ignavibacteriales bacterium]
MQEASDGRPLNEAGDGRYAGRGRAVRPNRGCGVPCAAARGGWSAPCGTRGSSRGPRGPRSAP